MRKVTLALVALAVLSQAWPASAVRWDDAGSGGDAPDAEKLALLLPALGTFSGFLSVSDADWYAHQRLSSPGCADLSLYGAPVGRATLVTQGGGLRRSINDTFNASSVRLAVAIPALDDVRIGIATTVPDGWNQGNYTFTLKTATPGQGNGDAGSGGDAGGTVASGLAVTPGCVAGRVSSSDLTDVYLLHVAEPTTLVLSFVPAGGASGVLELLSPSGSQLSLLTSASIAELTLPEPGTYSVSVSTPQLQVVEYVLGLTLGPEPPGSGCKPNCLG